MAVATRTDEDIKRDVVDELYWDDSVDAAAVEVAVHEGEVMLTGSVPDYAAYRSAEEDAWSLPGVHFVRNNLIVKFPYGSVVPADSEIKRNLDDSLRWQPNIDASDIQTSVERGWVTIRGNVDTYWKKVRLEDLALGLSGVAGVANELAVVPAGDIEDKTIARVIHQAFVRNATIAPDLIDIEVDEGKVRLMGSVPSLPAFRAVERIARRTPGVREVENRLIIR